ncbi:UDP-3-O-(3-hydroxymyristoyl)glucosamine N-acyltransferase [Candidatus Albibeggiatoa sp. nov. NOAA]|uniref:UDP-3-O-(3-hydroxymyristoyl)glucosamine N-acyltransferase n=1 Tax=Candidatus Albibeggiatoa sp. nov. NOAA TaxID=3162724 RepID=UPI00330156AF|nr:UDP-3-O-(3-hydroxymyristoyl)glucosamine N-acyltransferase [Thiotrichaceae bacterium]
MMVSISLAQLATQIGAQLNDASVSDVSISGIASLRQASSQQVSFFSNRLYRDDLTQTQAAAVILSAKDVNYSPVPALIMDNPYLGYAHAARLLNPQPKPQTGIHPTAWVSPDAQVAESASIGAQAVIEAGVQIGKNVEIGAGCVVGHNVQLGDNSRLIANVTLCAQTQVGQRCTIYPGAVIGADGFGLANDNGQWVKVPQLGKVVIGDDVDIGANTTIDRGALEDTIISNGVKLDNQIQIAHNVFIGEHTAIAGCVGIAGSTRIGKHCMIAGGVGIVGHIEITDNVQVTGGSIVLQSITESGIYSSGTPLEPSQHWRRNFHQFKHLNDIAKCVQTLKNKSELSST